MNAARAAETTVAQAGEERVVALLRSVFDTGPRAGAADHRATGRAVPLVANGDDAAVQPAAAGPVVSCVDVICAGNDWFDGWTPRTAVGHRALAVSLSDIAAMGALATGALLAWRMPPGLPLGHIEAAAEGMAALAGRHGVELLGGDIDIGAGPELLSVTALGTLPHGQAWRREGAVPGQRLWLIGEVGRAGLGLEIARRSVQRGDAAPPAEPGSARRALNAHLYPTPMLAAAARLRSAESMDGKPRVTAAIDVSDGLWLDARRLATASGVSLDLTLPRPTFWPQWLALQDDRASAAARLVSAGDDYALLVAAPAEVDVALIVGEDALALPVGVVHPAIAQGDPLVRLSVGGEPVRMDATGGPGGFLHGRAETR